MQDQSKDFEVMDIAACAAFLKTTEKAIRHRIERRQLPFRRFGGRIIFLKEEVIAFIRTLPGHAPDPEQLNLRE